MWLKPYLSSITWHYMSLKAKETYGIAIHTQNFRKKRNCQRVCCTTYYQGFMTAVHQEQNKEMIEPRIVLS